VASVEDMALNLLQPILYEIGERWARGELTATAEHVASNQIRSQLSQLVRLSPTPLRDGRVLIGCAPGETHDIGPLMVALFLRRRGFDVVYAGASVEPDSFITDVERLQPAVVCLSAARGESAQALATVFDALAGSYDGVLAFGGQAFTRDESLRDGVTGMYLGPDAAVATQQLEDLLSA
jgi:methanogenic corrinoid protein MtbC1